MKDWAEVRFKFMCLRTGGSNSLFWAAILEIASAIIKNTMTSWYLLANCENLASEGKKGHINFICCLHTMGEAALMFQPTVQYQVQVFTYI